VNVVFRVACLAGALLLFAPPAHADEPVPDAVVVHVTSDAPNASIVRYITRRARAPFGPPEVARTRVWTPGSNACAAPCDRAADTSALYLIDGPGIATSDLFSLPADRERVDIHVRAGSGARRAAGVYTMIGGALVTSLGAGIFSYTLFTPGEDRDTEKTTGGILFLAGLPVMVVGYLLYRASATEVWSGERRLARSLRTFGTF
jgi:hypothetical protein